jgi:hypothetical protein
MDYSYYQQAYLDQDLRRLNDAAFDLLWRVNPEAMVWVPEWLPEVLSTDAQRAAFELMRKLTLILDEVYDTETTSMAKNWSMCRGTVRKTRYPLRYGLRCL